MVSADLIKQNTVRSVVQHIAQSLPDRVGFATEGLKLFWDENPDFVAGERAGPPSVYEIEYWAWYRKNTAPAYQLVSVNTTE